MPQGTRELHRLAGDEDRQRRKGGEEAAATLFDNEPGVAELFCVFAGEFVVGDEGEPTGLEDADDLLECLTAGGRVVDVVDAEIGYDDIEGAVGEGHCLRRLAAKRAETGDALKFEVLLRGSSGVSTHIDVRPDVDAGGVAIA